MEVISQRPRPVANAGVPYGSCLISFRFDAFVTRAGEPDCRITVNFKRARKLPLPGDKFKWEVDPQAFEGLDVRYEDCLDFVKKHPDYAEALGEIWETLTSIGNALNASNKWV